MYILLLARLSEIITVVPLSDCISTLDMSFFMYKIYSSGFEAIFLSETEVILYAILAEETVCLVFWENALPHANMTKKNSVVLIDQAMDTL